MQRVVWSLYRVRERLGAWGLLGLFLLLAALLAYVFWLRPMQQRLVDLQQAVNTPTLSAKGETQTPEQVLHTYLQSLPPVSQRAVATQAVINLAEEQGLQLDEVTYKTDIRQDDPVAHYHMRFSLYLSYPEIQRFLSHLLHEQPYVAIDSLSLSRETVKDDLVEAQIEMVLNFNQLTQESAHGD